MARRFVQVDVFTDTAFTGNPLAVVVDAEDLSDDEMQRIANWTNLSETAFLLPPTLDAADYRVRIFTPAEELPFAGHPTLGSAHAWLTVGAGRGHEGDGDYEIVQECGVGLVSVRRTGTTLAFAAPPLIRSGAVSADELGVALEVLDVNPADVLDSAWIDNGPGWMGVLLRDADTVLRLSPGSTGGRDLKIGVVGAHPTAHPAAIEVRAFFSVGSELREDPVTGSLNASVAQWLIGSGVLSAPYSARQGTALGRSGSVRVEQADGDIWVGGETVTVIEGSITVR